MDSVLATGAAVEFFMIGDPGGSHVKLSSYGATLCSWVVPDSTGRLTNVVLGYENAEGLLGDTSYLGCTVGRVANRIGSARYQYGGKEICLQANEKGNLLHGGKHGLHSKNWQAKRSTHAVTFSCYSPDGEVGFPGDMLATVQYRVENIPGKSILTISYQAAVSEPTPVALTNHAYFNLSHADTVHSHTLSVGADFYTPIGAGMIPTGEILAVQNTEYDLTEKKLIVDILKKLPDGLDHNFVLHKKIAGDADATLACPETGRTLRTFTTEPGLQVYTGNFLHEGIVTNRGSAKRQGGICFETQAFPDFVNKKHFVGQIAKPGNDYLSETTYEISIG